MQDGEVDRFADSLVGYRRVGSYAVIRPPVQERFFEISFVMAGVVLSCRSLSGRRDRSFYAKIGEKSLRKTYFAVCPFLAVRPALPYFFSFR